MKFEYLIFNFIILLSPFLAYLLYNQMIFPNNVNYIISIVISSVLFIFHDIKVVNKWWQFNKKYILGIKIFNLPVEEILFFFITSFSCLVIWINLNKVSLLKNNLQFINLLFFSSVFFYYFNLYKNTKKPYPKFIFFSLVILIFFDLILGTNVIIKFKFLIFSIIVFILTSIFNYYLTKRPIVIYQSYYKSNKKILSIPVEDFLYGFNFIYLTILLSEFFSKISIFFK